jgi:hypothetical protein
MDPYLWRNDHCHILTTTAHEPTRPDGHCRSLRTPLQPLKPFPSHRQQHFTPIVPDSDPFADFGSELESR